MKMSYKDLWNELAESIIENNCLECEEFGKDIRTSPCICEPLNDIIQSELRGHNFYGSELVRHENTIHDCWRAKRSDILRSMKPRKTKTTKQTNKRKVKRKVK
jgi:hypothetical protein